MLVGYGQGLGISVAGRHGRREGSINLSPMKAPQMPAATHPS